MSLSHVGAAALRAAAGTGSSPAGPASQPFSQVLGAALKSAGSTGAATRAALPRPAPAARAPDPVKQVAAAQRRMDAVLALAESGRSFTPAELLALQSRVYRASQELDLAGKVVEKATGGVKQVLQTQL